MKRNGKKKILIQNPILTSSFFCSCTTVDIAHKLPRSLWCENSCQWTDRHTNQEKTLTAHVCRGLIKRVFLGYCGLQCDVFTDTQTSIRNVYLNPFLPIYKLLDLVGLTLSTRYTVYSMCICACFKSSYIMTVFTMHVYKSANGWTNDLSLSYSMAMLCPFLPSHI